MGLGDDSLVLNENAAVSLVIVDVLVDGLVTDDKGSVNPEVVGDLLWAPVLFEQSDDVFPEVGGEVEAASLASSSGSRIAVGQVGAILAIDELLVALKFPTNGTGGALESAGNIGFGLAAYPKLGDVVPFILRELVVSIHVASLSCRKLMLVVSQLSHFRTRVLHLLLESTTHNKSLQLSPKKPTGAVHSVCQFHSLLG